MLPLVFYLVLAQAADPIASLTPTDLARGKKLFAGHCALCHGQTGEGGKGPSLAMPRLRRAADNKALFEVIKNGIRDSEMPAFWMMTDHEIWLVAGYVRSLGRTAVAPVAGDAERGKAVYAKAGCAACHIVRGQGSSLGPELTEVGARRSPAHLKEALINPAAAVPDGFAIVRAVTRDGGKIEGVRVSEDTFTIQLRDASNRFHSLRKQDLADLKKDFNQSPMPSYQSTLTPAELDDLVGYLASLRGDS